jgi:hypothetical protein
VVKRVRDFLPKEFYSQQELVIDNREQMGLAQSKFGSSGFCVEGRRIGIIFQKHSLQSFA